MISNFPNLLTCSCELFGQEIELSESNNIESSGSRLGKFNFLPFSASPMYLPPESSVSCHLHETAGALRHPRVLTLRFRAHTKNTGALPRSRSRALAQTPALPLPRTRARTQNAGAPPTHCARALSQNEGGTGFVPRPAFLRPDISTGCLCGRARCRLVFGCRPRLLVAAGIRLLAVLPALRPLVTGHRAGRHPPCRLLAACALLAGAGLQLVGLRLRDLGPRNQPQITYLRMTFWPLSSSLRAQWPQWYSASASDTVPSPNIKRCVP